MEKNTILLTKSTIRVYGPLFASDSEMESLLDDLHASIQALKNRITERHPKFTIESEQ